MPISNKERKRPWNFSSWKKFMDPDLGPIRCEVPLLCAFRKEWTMSKTFVLIHGTWHDVLVANSGNHAAVGVWQPACSPRCDCGVSFQRPRRLALCSAPLDLAVGLVWVKTADRTSASRRRPTAEAGAR